MPKAYVDGSYNIHTQRFGYGVVLFTGKISENGEEEILRLSKSFGNPELAQMRNVAGEIMGAAEAMKTAASMGITELDIYHDYEGIAKWCTGEWKTKKTWTKKYKAFYDDMAKTLKVRFHKVEAHTGDVYNEEADKLAKQAVENPL